MTRKSIATIKYKKDPAAVHDAIMQAMTLKAINGDTKAAKVVLAELNRKNGNDSNTERVVIIDDV